MNASSDSGRMVSVKAFDLPSFPKDHHWDNGEVARDLDSVEKLLGNLAR